MSTVRSFRYSQLAILLAALVLLGIFALAFQTVRSFRATSDAVLHTQDIRVQFTETFSHQKDIFNSTRAYLANGDERLLSTRQQSLADYDHAMANLRQLVSGDPADRAAISHLDELATQLKSEYDACIELRRTEGPATVTTHLAGGELKRVVEELRKAAEDYQASQAARLDGQLKGVRRDTTLTLAVLGGGLGLDVLLVVAVVLMQRRDFRTREAAAAEMRRHSAEIQDLYNHAPCGYHSLGPDGRFVAINDTELNWLGYTREEVIGHMSLPDIVSPADRTAVQNAFARVKDTGAVRDVEVQARRKDGSTFPASISGGAIRDAAGGFVATRATLFDLTERKRIEELTADARAYAESIVDTVREPLAILTSDLRINSANLAFYQRFDTTAAAVVGRSLSEIDGGRWSIPGLLQRLHRSGAEGSELRDFEVTREVPRLGTRIMLLNARTLARSTIGSSMLLLALEDITDRRQAEARLQDLNTSLRVRTAELEGVNRELEAFSYSVSHDLRAPLRHIDYFASALRKHLPDATFDAKSRRFLDTISSSARNMGQLIDDLLSFARISRTELRHARVQLDELVAETRQGLHTETAGRAVAWSVSPLPEVHGDAALLRQVFMNLLSNAVKYTRRCAEARIEVAAQPGGPGEVVVVVRDNGAGFDMKYADKLFGVFQRLHANHEFEGTGVGLANVRRIVERHGGRIWAEAVVDRGATFYVSLPAAPLPA